MVLADLDVRRVRVRHLLSLAIAATSLCLGVALATSAFAVTFNPALIISDDNMRAYDSMSQSDIQAFLETQKGPLKSLVTTEHAAGKDNKTPSKVTKKASLIIWEACQEWHVNPRVILATLQKEQSLLTRTSLDKNTLSRSIGAGCPNGSTNHYPGFGSQMWFGAKLLDQYGEGKNGSSIPLWKPPSTDYEDTFKCNNLATYKQYVYTPSYSGPKSFWTCYQKYFGDTFAIPAVRPIYRLRNAKNGNYFYTKSQTERYQFVKSGVWKYERVGFSWDTSATANKVPVYRFLNRKTREYLFTASPKMVRWLKGPVKSPLWRADGVAFKCSMSATSAAAVHQFTNKKTGRYFLTTSTAEKTSMLSSKNRKTWSYAGVVFYMAHR